MTQKFEDYEALERYRAEWEIAMKRIEEAAKRRRTRMEHRQRRARNIWLVTIFLWASFLVILLLLLPPRVSATEQVLPEDPGPVSYTEPIGPGGPEEDAIEEEAQEDYENEKIEAALLAKAIRLEDVTVTHYDPCVKCCGKTDGITATGVPVTPYYTVAVDPEIIPLGSEVLVDYGDGVIHYYRAEDTGGGVKGKHLDLCVTDHTEALTLGVRRATVWFLPTEGDGNVWKEKDGG